MNATMQEALLDAISTVSESRWSAGWLNKIEDILREEKIPQLIVLARLAGGWPNAGYRGDSGWSDLTTEEKLIADKILSGVNHRAMSSVGVQQVEIGFTGTREGLTDAQRQQLKLCFEMMKLGASKFFAVILHHGSCVGADEQVHMMAWTMGMQRAVHPPTDEKLMAVCIGERRYEPKPYLERNKDIVNAGQILIACPKETTDPISTRSSGTWSTIRYAMYYGHKPVLVIFADGKFEWR